MQRTSWGIALVLALTAAGTAGARTIVVHAGESIQATVDAAPAGATIRVEPGVYHETGSARAVTITKAGIHLIAAARPGRPVVIEQAGTQTQGIWVSPGDSLAPEDVELPPCGVSGQRLARFQLSGFTVRGFEGFGVYLACVDGFRIEGNEVHANLTYAVFPVRSSHGRMTRNKASGTRSDACLYTGQDERILVDHNEATDCLIGLQIENSVHVRMTHNVSTGNTAGMIVDVIDGRQTTVESDNFVTDNVFRDNNRPNTAPPGLETAGLPRGMGLIVVGADRTLIARNLIAGSAFAGLSFTGFCISAPGACAHPLDINPTPEMNRIVDNRFEGNANDVIYLPLGGKGNCFAHNRPKTLKTAGAPLPVCH
jgi:nitrous oxidase accessory protein NosD